MSERLIQQLAGGTGRVGPDLHLVGVVGADRRQPPANPAMDAAKAEVAVGTPGHLSGGGPGDRLQPWEGLRITGPEVNCIEVQRDADRLTMAGKPGAGKPPDAGRVDVDRAAWDEVAAPDHHRVDIPVEHKARHVAATAGCVGETIGQPVAVRGGVKWHNIIGVVNGAGLPGTDGSPGNLLGVETTLKDAHVGVEASVPVSLPRGLRLKLLVEGEAHFLALEEEVERQN